MKKILLAFPIMLLALGMQAQQMHVKNPNFTSFHEDKKAVPAVLDKKSSATGKLHPEYGVLPYNAPCAECVELIDNRTETARRFIDKKNAGHFYCQQSYFPLHYKQNENDVWRTIDKRLKPDANNPGVFVANNQPVPTKCDLNKKSTSLYLDGFEFEFNKHLSLYFFDENKAYTKPEAGNYTDYTIGEEGLRIKNMWNGIDMVQQFSNGKIETNYVISAPLHLPINSGWMVIEDHFTLPEGYKFEESLEGTHTEKGHFQGDYELKNPKGEVTAVYKKAIYLDAKVWGLRGNYNLLRDAGNNYTLQILVPVEWLNNKDNIYPLVIDPLVEGITQIGNFIATGGNTAYLAYSSMALGSCDYYMEVDVPGKSTLTNAYVGLEYELTYDGACDNSQLNYPYCTFSQVVMQVKNDTCGTFSGPLGCFQEGPPYTGTCTTDTTMVGADSAYWGWRYAILINNTVPDFLSCISPQCGNYKIPFTLSNQDSICGDVCNYLCARGNLWFMSVEAEQVYGNISADTDNICPGTPVVFTASAIDGVGGIGACTFVWVNDTVILDTIIGSNTYTFYPQHTTGIYCIVIDSCGEIGYSNPIIINVNPSITTSGDTLSATTGTSYQWYLNDTIIPGATSQSYIAIVAGNYSVVEKGDSCPSSPIYFTPTGIKNIVDDSHISLIPNPSDGNFILRFNADAGANNALLRITDARGRIIFSKNISIATGANTYTFSNADKFANGIYNLQIEAAGKVFGKKLVVSK